MSRLTRVAFSTTIALLLLLGIALVSAPFTSSKAEAATPGQAVYGGSNLLAAGSWRGAGTFLVFADEPGTVVSIKQAGKMLYYTKNASTMPVQVGGHAAYPTRGRIQLCARKPRFPWRDFTACTYLARVR